MTDMPGTSVVRFGRVTGAGVHSRSDEGIPMEVIVPAANGCERGDSGRLRFHPRCTPARLTRDLYDTSYVVKEEDPAFGHIPYRLLRKKGIVVDQIRAVIDLEKQIFVEVVCIEQIAGYSRSLGHPVKPETPVGVMYTIPANKGM